ncbi:hypothetical protein P3L10_026406 [Capsicum annuum]
MKKLLWWAAWSTYEEDFKDQLSALGALSEEAVKDLLKYNPFAKDEQGARLKRRKGRIEEEEEEEEEVQDNVYDISSSVPQPTQEREDQRYEPFGPASEPESDPGLRHKIVPEATRLVVRQTLRISDTSGSRSIGFRGDFAGVSESTDLPYSPSKLTWKGKKAITTNHLENAREMKLGKLKAKKAIGRTQI